MKNILALLVLFLFTATDVQSQDPTRFSEEVAPLEKLSWDAEDDREKLLFTGSSSIRFWYDLPDYFTDFQVMNTGFGGSQFSDLIFYAEELILRHKPDRIFIYEGDNDVSAGKSAQQIAEDAERLIGIIREKLPDSQIYLISPKPSVARWELKDKYLKSNASLKALASESENVNYIDVWYAMLNQDGEPNAGLFIEDMLHMNKKGYDIWGEIILGALIPSPCR